MKLPYKLVNEQTGFTWGPCKVTRLCDHESGAYLMIRGKREQVEIRVTPGGRIRVGPIIKRKEPK